MTEAEPVDWILIGRGQEEDKVRRMLGEAMPKRLVWIPWVPYAELKDQIAQADICLGIFGDTGKAARVIPNKVFQVLSSRVALVTRDSPAIRELLSDRVTGIRLVPPNDASALVRAVRELSTDEQETFGGSLYGNIVTRIAPAAIGRMIAEVTSRASKRTTQVCDEHRA